MAPIPNPRIVFKAIPAGFLVPGEHTTYETDHTIDLETVPLNGGFLTKTLVVSPEPYMRGRMRDRSVPSYSSILKLGAPITGLCVVVVIRSENPQYAVGTYMYGMTPWEAYTVQPYMESRLDFKPEEWPPYTFNMDDFALFPVPDPQGAFPLSAYVGALGTPGFTAYCGVKKLADMKKGETIYVSTGAGGVGSMVCQLAKLAGLKVIASAGSDDKVEYMKTELSVDFPFNYKKTPVAEALKKYGPINIYWDNVGGDTLSAAIDACTLHSRIVMCGYISEYNTTDKQGVKHLDQMFKKRINMLGCFMPDYAAELLGPFYGEIAPLVAQGKIKSKETLVKGLENTEAAFVSMMNGDNPGGKVAVIVTDP